MRNFLFYLCIFVLVLSDYAIDIAGTQSSTRRTMDSPIRTVTIPVGQTKIIQLWIKLHFIYSLRMLGAFINLYNI